MNLRSFLGTSEATTTVTLASIALILGITLLWAPNLPAQSDATVNFANNSTCLVTNGPTGNLVSISDNVRAALYWGAIGSGDFVQIGGTVTVGTPLAGLFDGGTRSTGAATAGGASARFQVRAWSGSSTTYEQALLVPGVLIGSSAIFTNNTGDPLGTPPMPPISISGGRNHLKGFTLSPNKLTAVLTVNCATNKTVSCTTGYWAFDPPTGSTTCDDTNVMVVITGTTTNNQGCSQVLTRTWQLSDNCGNTNTCSQQVTVQFDAPPVIVCASNKTVSCSTIWTFDTPTAYDPCSGTNLAVIPLGAQTNAAGCTQTITQTWQAVNPCTGASNNCSQVVTVLCSNCTVIVVAKNCPPYPVPPGGLLVSTGTVTNVSNLILTNVVVVNDHPATNTLVYGPITLLPGAWASFTNSYSVAACDCGPHTDTLNASASDFFGNTYTAFATASCPGTNYAVLGDLNGDGIVDQNELNQVLANYWAHAPGLYMTNPAALCNGYFQFALTNVTGWNFTVLVSTNFTDWTNLPGAATPLYQFLNPQGTNSPVRFYRLQYP